MYPAQRLPGDVAKLPPLDTLRTWIVGLLNEPAAQLSAVLILASGGQLVRTLEGLKKSLEDKAVLSAGESTRPPSS